MLRRSFLSLFLCFIACSPSRSESAEQPQGEAGTTPIATGEQTLVHACNEFSMKLLRAITTTQVNPSDNICYSPFSICNVLLSAGEGARGKTATQIATTLQLPPTLRSTGDRENTCNLSEVTSKLMSLLHRVTSHEDESELFQLRKQIADLQRTLDRYGPEASKQHNQSDTHDNHHSGLVATTRIRNQISRLQQRLDGPKIAVANAIWLADIFPLSSEYQARLTWNLACEAFECNFRDRAAQEAARINEWVSTTTKKRITDLIGTDAIEPNTPLVLTNAIYFRANWLKPFEKSSTRPVNFTTTSGNYQVTVMTWRVVTKR